MIIKDCIIYKIVRLMFVASFHCQIKSLVDSCVRWKYDVVESCGLPSETSGRTDRRGRSGEYSDRSDRSGKMNDTQYTARHDVTDCFSRLAYANGVSFSQRPHPRSTRPYSLLHPTMFTYFIYSFVIVCLQKI